MFRGPFVSVMGLVKLLAKLMVVPLGSWRIA